MRRLVISVCTSGSSKASSSARLAATARPVIIVCAQAAQAQRLVDEIRWFAPSLNVRLFPDWETLPYDAFSPHQDLVSERLATLHEIRNGQCDVLVVPATTALVRLAPTIGAQVAAAAACRDAARGLAMLDGVASEAISAYQPPQTWMARAADPSRKREKIIAAHADSKLPAPCCHSSSPSAGNNLPAPL